MIEQERKETNDEMSSMRKDLEKHTQKNETKMFVIRNRLHVLAQYTRIKIPADGMEPEDILKVMISKIKNNNEESDVDTHQYLKNKIKHSESMVSEQDYRVRSRGRFIE